MLNFAEKIIKMSYCDQVIIKSYFKFPIFLNNTCR